MDRKTCVNLASISLGLFVVLCGGAWLVSSPGSRIYEFFFHRSFVQFLTLSVFSLLVVLVGHRGLHCAREHKVLEAARRGSGDWRKGPGVLGELHGMLRNALIEQGAQAVPEALRKSVQVQKEKIRSGHEVLGFLMCALPALGLFGTVLGLSDSLYAAFSGSRGGPEMIHQFVTALSTALDTTILGLGCSMLLGAPIWLLGRLENQLVVDCAAYLDGTVSLEEPTATVAEETQQGGADRPARSLDVLRAELRALTLGIVEEAAAGFRQLGEESRDSLRDSVRQAMLEGSDAQRRREEAMVAKLASDVSRSMDQSLKAIGALLEKQNGRAAKDFVQQVRQLEKTLRRRTPDEVIIRYDHNGHSQREVGHAES